uniref:tumor susceptibility gene 101 protein-like isoform X1 n=1 Tax=Ciona intestinalis TaxID=7719 RepID=UPI000180B374|nr:tumor susceptibility gene 101 protein-like isoform X1 [Ciona intestinalis]|eukprot:XP_002127340.1 tumor susceptibility gene 101 protein-like isoform X1 [Ciona intestinalis]
MSRMSQQQYSAYLKSQMQGKYTQLDLAKKDALSLMHHYKDLQPKMDRFIYNDGSTKNLMSLCGTIPVNYKGTTYNIPIAIWLQESHPQLPPLCFVKPTSNMQVKQGKHVDANGRVYLPYLNEWTPHRHTLIGLTQVLVAMFGEEPPVFAKPSGPPQRPPQPYPAQNRTPYPTPGYTAQGPPTTNYQPNVMSPYPPAMPSQQPTPYPATNTPGYPGYPPQPGYPPVNTSPYPPQPHQPVVQPMQQKDQSLDENMIKASLRSAANDRLKLRLKETLSQAEAENSQLKQVGSELKGGQERLQTIIKKLQLEIDEADANIIMLEQKNEEAKQEIELTEKKQDDLDVDDIVMATTPVYRQIVTSFAEEQALEDTIYYLGEALRKDVLDVDTFLKHVRSLSRQQFMLRAVIQKARKSAGLANIY